MSALNVDDAIAEIILAWLRDPIYIDPSELAPFRFQSNCWARPIEGRKRLIESRKRYLHSGGFSTDGVHRTVQPDCNGF
jgi:hypothetical protein